MRRALIVGFAWALSACTTSGSGVPGCRPGEQRCGPSGVESCQADSSGKGVFVTTLPCPSGCLVQGQAVTCAAGATGSSGGSGSGGSSGGTSGTFPIPKVTITAPLEGSCVSLRGGPTQVSFTTTNFELSAGSCGGAGPCGKALLQLEGPTGSCDDHTLDGLRINADGTSPLVPDLGRCPQEQGPSGPRLPSGDFTAALYLLRFPSATLVTAPDGGPLQTVHFRARYGDGFRPCDDPELVLLEDINQRIDGIVARNGRVFVANNAGGNGSVIAVPEAPPGFGIDAGIQVLIPPPQAGWASAIAADDTDVYVSTSNVPWAVLAVAQDGGPVRTLSPDDGGLQNPAGPCFGQSAGSVFWSGSGQLWQSVAGGPGQPVLGGPSNPIYPACIAADATHLYWLDGSGDLRRDRIGGGAAAVLATGLSSSRDLIVDDTWAFWSQEGLGGAQGSILRIDKSGAADGGFAVVAGALINPGQLLEDRQDGGAVFYWADGQGVTRQDAAGNIARIPSPYFGNRSGSSLTYLSLDGDFLYFADDAHVFRVRK